MPEQISSTLNAHEIFDADEGHIPDDITLLSPEELRIAHSYWVGCHNYGSGVLARIQRKIKELKRRREIRFKTLFLSNKRDRQSNEVARFNAELDHNMIDIDDKMNGLEQHEIIWSSLVKQCDYNRTLLSRDQSYRQEELSTYYGRGGQGR